MFWQLISGNFSATKQDVAEWKHLPTCVSITLFAKGSCIWDEISSPRAFLFNFRASETAEHFCRAQEGSGRLCESHHLFFLSSHLGARGGRGCWIFSPEGNTGAALGTHCAAARGLCEAVCITRCLRQGQPQSAAARNEKHAPTRAQSGVNSWQRIWQSFI